MQPYTKRRDLYNRPRLALDWPSAVCGDSINQGLSSTGSPAMDFAMSRGLLFPLAVGGLRSDEMLPQIMEAVRLGARRIYLNGGANDISQGRSPDVRRKNYVENILAALPFAEVVWCGLPPVNIPGRVKAYVEDETFMRIWCWKNDVPFVSYWEAIATAAGAFTASMNADDLHPSALGVETLGPGFRESMLYPSFKPLLAMVNSAADQGSFIQNAVSFAGGPPQTGWGTFGTGSGLSTVAGSGTDFGNWARCTLTAATNAGIQCVAQTFNSQVGWQRGDVLASGCNVRSNGSVSIRLRAVGLGIDAYPERITNYSASVLLENRRVKGEAYGYAEYTYNKGNNVGFVAEGTGTGYFEINRPTVVNLSALSRGLEGHPASLV